MTEVSVFTPDQGGAGVGPGEVHGWLVDLDGVADRAGEVLDNRERERARTYLRPADGANFAASRAALRRVLAGYVGSVPQSLEFVTDQRGRPRLTGASLQFSLARSAGLALIAIAAGPVGADVELIQARPGLADLAAARFGASESACLARGHCAGSPVRGFYRHWTAKEAYLKAVGRGLRALPDAELDCDLPPGIRFRGRPAAGWALSVSDAGAGYACAIVARDTVTHWRKLAA